MATIPLTNDGWSYESNCFVCEATNDSGLAIPFFHDTDADTVTATFSLDRRYSGAPSLVHGGLVLAITDEAMAWAAIALAGKFAMTIETSSKFVFPVVADADHTVVARVEKVDDAGMIHTSATVTAASGDLCTTSEALFFPISVAQANTISGDQDVTLSDEERSYLRDD